MDHSVQAYLQRQSTEKLIQFLQQCAEFGQQECYAPILPEIIRTLENRGVSIPRDLLPQQN